MEFEEKIRTLLQSPLAPPHYPDCIAPPAKNWVPPASPENAVALHRLLVFRLRKYATNKTERALRKLIEKCEKSKPCASSACPKCMYAWQGITTDLHLDLREGGIVLDQCFTIIPRLFFEPSDEPGRDVETAVAKVNTFHKRLDKAFLQSGLTTVVGGIDFDYHEFPDEKIKDHCRPHFHGLAFSVQFDSGEKQLRSTFENKGSVNRSVQKDTFDGKENWLRYILKIPNSRKIRTKDDDGLWADSDYKSLTVQQHLQQTMVLNEIGWSGRVHLRGVDLIEGRRGWRFVLTDAAAYVAN